MKLLSLPKKLLLFWYPHALILFARAWKNTIFYIEEDLAIGLMAKLLFTPLFHDSSIVGRFLSFFFRGSRILMGLFAYLLATLMYVAIALYWFMLPAVTPLFLFNGVSLFLPYDLALSGVIIFFSGLVLFTHHILFTPEKKLWEIRDKQEILKCSLVDIKNITLPKLLKQYQVVNLLGYLEKKPEDFKEFPDDNNLEKLEEKLWEVGKSLSVPYLGYEHFFVSKLLCIPNLESLLAKMGLSEKDLMDVLDFMKKKSEEWKMFFVWDENFHVKHLKGVNRGWLGVPTLGLDLVSEDLTSRASKTKMDDFLGREDVVRRVIDILSLEKGRNVVLVGEPGSGKSTLVNYLAKVIISGDAPEALATKRVVALDLTKLLTGVKTQGELAERVKNAFDDASFCGNIIIFIDEIQNLGLGEAGSEFNLYSLMMPYIESSQFQFITVTEPGNYTKILEKNGSFARLFAKVELPPASVDETIDTLKIRAIETERYKKISTSLLAIKDIAKLSSDYIHDRVLPDSALQVYEECLVEAKERWVTKEVVDQVIQARVKVPVGEVAVEEKKQLLNLEETIHEKMVDQVEAVTAVSTALRRSAAQLRDKNKPIGSFLFVGPTGVGKTELAKTLSEVYFKGSGNFARFDMSEYQTADSITRLIGDENNEGLLTETVRNKPYTLLLLDEFEKADEKVLRLFLQVLDDGRLTSGTGKTVDFTSTIIIATSNVASLTIAKGLESGQTLEQLDKPVNDELLTIFKPELINRFDDVILFKTLSEEDLIQIVKIKLTTLGQMLYDQGFRVVFTEGLVTKLVEVGFDPVLGARPLRRLIQDTLEARLSVMILENKLPKGEQFIVTEQLMG